jgi:hypothetical protein
MVNARPPFQWLGIAAWLVSGALLPQKAAPIVWNSYVWMTVLGASLVAGIYATSRWKAASLGFLLAFAAIAWQSTRGLGIQMPTVCAQWALGVISALTGRFQMELIGSKSESGQSP